MSGGGWRVAYAANRNDESERIILFASSPRGAAERFAETHYEDAAIDPFAEPQCLHVAVWVDGEPKCYEVTPYVAYDADECEWPAGAQAGGEG